MPCNCSAAVAIVKPSVVPPRGTDSGVGSDAGSGAVGGVGNGSGRTPLEAHAPAVTITTPSAMPATARRFMLRLIGTSSDFEKLKWLPGRGTSGKTIAHYTGFAAPIT